MWVCLVEMRARPGQEGALVRMCEEWMAGAPAKGCAAVELLFDDRDPSLVTLLEHWDDKESFETNAAHELADPELMTRFAAITDGAPQVRQYRPHAMVHGSR